ncbi:MAG TPA: hypothetical protein VFP05_12770 [Thermomicrobiales bacterium]|nr:hypothetical protein [Thermomicrobiales bacterium]
MDPDASQETPANGDTPPDAKDEGTLSAVQRRLEGKPVLIYGTLVGGAVALLLLLMIVWLSTRDNGSPVNLCLDTTVSQAQAAVLDGGVRRADVLIDAEQPMEGLTAIQLELQDGECRKLPEGADNRDILLQVLGLIELYNQEGDGNIRVEYQREDVPPNLLLTSTAIPTLSPTGKASPLAGTPLPVLGSSPTPTPTDTVTPSPTPTFTPTATPATPIATGSPLATP